MYRLDDSHIKQYSLWNGEQYDEIRTSKGYVFQYDMLMFINYYLFRDIREKNQLHLYKWLFT